VGLLIWGFPVFSPYHPVSLSPHQQDRNTRFCLLVQRTSCLSTKAERPHGYRQLGVSRYAVDPVHWQSLGAWPDSLDRHPRGVAVPPPLFQPFGLRRTHPTWREPHFRQSKESARRRIQLLYRLGSQILLLAVGISAQPTRPSPVWDGGWCLRYPLCAARQAETLGAWPLLGLSDCVATSGSLPLTVAVWGLKRRTHPTREQVPYPGAGLLPLADIRPLSPGREVGMSLSTLRGGTCIAWLPERGSHSPKLVNEANRFTRTVSGAHFLELSLTGNRFSRVTSVRNKEA